MSLFYIFVCRQVGLFSVTDPDNELVEVQSFTLTLAGSTTAILPFALVNDTSIIETTANLDFEQRQVYELNITATDDGVPELSLTKTVTVQVSPDSQQGLEHDPADYSQAIMNKRPSLLHILSFK